MNGWSPAEDRERAVELDRTDREEARKDRLELIHDCPRTLVLDDAHLYAVLRDGWATQFARNLTRTMVLRGLAVSGYDKATIARGMQITLEDLERELERELYWTPPAELLAKKSELARTRYTDGARPAF